MPIFLSQQTDETGLIMASVRLCFAVPVIGRTSEVWMYRQLVGFRRLSPHVLTWGRENSEQFPLNGVPLDVLAFDRHRSTRGRWRWLHRLRMAPTGNFYAAAGRERSAIVTRLQEMQPHLILCHYGHMALKVLPAARQLGIPLVAHFHGVDISSGLQATDRWYDWSLGRSAARLAACVVVNSEQKRRLEHYGCPGDRIHIIPCGVPTEAFRPHGIQYEVPRFIAVSRLIDIKGLQYTLRAFATVAAAVPEAQLTIVGDGPLRSDLEVLAHTLDVADRVVFTGAVDPAAVQKLLGASSVFVQHSTVREGSPVSLAEAAACALPIVSTRCGGIPELVLDGEMGFLVDQYDVEGMAAHMLELAQDPELCRRMGQAGRARMIEHFDTQKQITALEDVLLWCATH